MIEKVIREQLLDQMGDLKEEERIIINFENIQDPDRTITTTFLTIICC